MIAALLVVNLLRAQNLEVVTPKAKTVFSLSELKSKIKVVQVKIEDPVYGKTKEYDAFPLTDILHLGGVSPGENADELVFTALDGYAPNVSFAKLRQHQAFVAFKEHSGNFAPVKQGKAEISPGPFYVVWAEGAKLKDEVPWAYQLAKLEVVDWAAKYPKVIPTGGEPMVMKGFTVFKAECIRCHSINLQGGDLGPELNSPKNITEYWKPDVLRSFIADNSKFRYKSKMPVFSHLSGEQIDQVIAYLKFMKKTKI